MVSASWQGGWFSGLERRVAGQMGRGWAGPEWKRRSCVLASGFPSSQMRIWGSLCRATVMLTGKGRQQSPAGRQGTGDLCTLLGAKQ